MAKSCLSKLLLWNIIFLGIFSPAFSQVNSQLTKFFSGIEKVAEDIINEVPEWNEYVFEEKLILSGDTEKTELQSTEVFARPLELNETIASAIFPFDIGSLAVQPYVALMWIKGYPKITTLKYQVNVDRKVKGGLTEINKSSFRADDLSINYHWNQTYGSDIPTVVNLFFYVVGENQSWNSTSPTSADFNGSSLVVSGSPKNVLLGSMLLSRSAGTMIPSSSIHKIIRIMLSSFQRVLCDPSQQPCQDDEFDCRCGGDIAREVYQDPHCIPRRWRCDGTPDCPDGRDEDNCICPEGFLQCGCDKGGASCPYRYQCVPNSKLCDGIQDCESYNDERVNDCAFNCTISEESIRDTLECDGKRDCQDFSDEMNCSKNPQSLPYRCDCNTMNGFSCTGNYSFYSEIERCDGIKTCSDFSDEKNCSSCPAERPNPCHCNSQDSFTCTGNFSCYSNASVCDRINDCSDITDEENCTAVSCTGQNSLSCDCNTYLNFTCVGRGCYSEADHCDGWIDCSDGSDEANCSCPSFFPHRCNCGSDCKPVATFNYTDRRKNILFIPVAFSCFSDWDGCNGEKNCEDASDEICENCTEKRPYMCDCYKNGHCQSGTPPCYNVTEKCNNKLDCSDGTDEREFCTCPSEKNNTCACINSTNSEILESCLSRGKCYSEEEKCNGVQNCLNWTDELVCMTCPPLDPWACACLHSGNVSCTSRPCIKNNQVCDGKVDCSDRSDEENCLNCTEERSYQCGCNQVGQMCSKDRPPCIIASKACDGNNDCKDWSDERSCDCTFKQCDCSRDGGVCESGPDCYNPEDVCNGYNECIDKTDENNCSICPESRPLKCFCNNQSNSFCNNSLPCYNRLQMCDGIKDCESGSDEWGCKCNSNGTVDNLPCVCKGFRNSSVCVGRRSCYEPTEKCNERVNCEDRSDEWNCSCQAGELKCACKLLLTEDVCVGNMTCYNSSDRCNAISNCEMGDVTDEKNCSCPANMSACRCFKSENPTCSMEEGCIPSTAVNDGERDCEDRSDEEHLIDVQFESCDSCKNVTLWRLDKLEGCTKIGLPKCDNTTCKTIPGLNCSDLNCNETNVICFSQCNSTNPSCKMFFQCQDHSILLGFKFCNGIPECADGTDEIRNGFGLTCQSSANSTFSCVLPQWNLVDDDTPQCSDKADVCVVNGKNTCFPCYGEDLKISESQVCDGIVNCANLSDECLCRNNLNETLCTSFFPGEIGALQCSGFNKACLTNPSTIVTEGRCLSENNTVQEQSNTTSNSKMRCDNKYGQITAEVCNGIPECSNFQDECNNICNQSFCNHPCSSFYQLGDRYCNGYNDVAWTYINRPGCAEGFDEKPELCNKTRFPCTAGQQVSISRSFFMDEIVHCDKGEDERAIFSSDEEMIENAAIRYFIWIIAVITLVGNIYVVVSTFLHIKRKDMPEAIRTNHILILNLGIADLLMGIYLLIISIKSASFSPTYGEVDLMWRSSDLCTTAGSLAIISSETSCFIMSALSSFRLMNVVAPFRARLFPTWPWYVLLAFIWIFACLIAVVPAIYLLSDYFVYQLYFPAPFATNTAISLNQSVTIGCRYASLVDVSYNLNSSSWIEVIPRLSDLFPEVEARLIGYYGETSLCMPRFYVDGDDNAAAFSLVVISINFVSFVYVCISYFAIYKITAGRPVSNKQLDVQAARMQKRIARLLVTDFICWIPICIIAFAKASLTFDLPNDVYAATIGFLLPINSALNPILYSSFFESLVNRLCNRSERENENSKNRSNSKATIISENLTSQTKM